MNKILPAACLSLLCLSAQADQRSGDWRFSLAPYIWGMSLNGDVGLDGVTVPVNQSFSELWSDLNFAGMLFFDAHYRELGIFMNIVYTKISASETVDGVKANTTNIYSMLTPGLSYQVVSKQQLSDSTTFTFEPYVGARITFDDTTLKYDGVKTTSNQDWTDALIGARFIFNFYKQWTLSFTGDVGGTTSSDQYSYNAIGLVGYEFGNTVVPVSLFAGYRYLHQTYITNTFEWDMSIQGPILGVEVGF